MRYKAHALRNWFLKFARLKSFLSPKFDLFYGMPAENGQARAAEGEPERRAAVVERLKVSDVRDTLSDHL